MNATDQLRLWQRFHIRLSFIYGGVVFLVLTAFSVLFYTRGVESEMHGLKARLRGIAMGLAEGVSAADLTPLQTEGDAGRPEYQMLVSRFAKMAEEEEDVVSIYVLRPTDRPGWLRFAADYVRPSERAVPAAKVGQLYDGTQAHKLLDGLTQPTVEDTVYTDEWGVTLSGYAPVRAPDGTSLGLVGVDVSAARLDALRRQVLLTTLAFYTVAAALVGIASLVVARNIRGPLSKIIGATSSIADGHFEVRSNLVRGDEFGILGRHFDEMAAGLQDRERIRDTFGRYVNPEVVRRVLASSDGSSLGGVEREVTVVVSDLCNYSTVSEHLPPQHVIGLLNQYLNGMNEVIDAHGGTIIDFLGDGILCVFNAPTDQLDHAERALRCAVGMRERLDQLNVEIAKLNVELEANGLPRVWKLRGAPDLAARIGIHTGLVVAGNVGSPRHMKYAVIGDPVNVAARCEALNKQLDTGILVTAAVYQQLPEDLRRLAQARGAHQVKGREQLVEVYSV